MKVIGIDPGSRTTGYGIVESAPGGKLLLVSAGQISPGTSLSMEERLLRINKELSLVIDEHRPQEASVESVFHAKNVRSAIMLGHARGVALLSAAEHKIPVFEYSPSVIKLSVVGYGSATKAQVQKMIKSLLKSKQTFGADASDALAAAICHLHHASTAMKLSQASAK
jgi:crossover junction endodeoxyribonuclease RuvC